MKKRECNDQLSRDIRKAKLRLDTLMVEIEHNIAQTKKEIEERKKIREKRWNNE